MTASRPGRTTIEVPTWVADLSDRGVQAAIVLALVAMAGFAGLGLAWSGVASTLLAPIQMPFIVSGAIGGVAIAGTALALLATHLERRSSASDRAQFEVIIEAATGIAEDLAGVAARESAGLVRNGLTIHRRDCWVIKNRQVDALGPRVQTTGLRACGVCRPGLPYA